MGTENEFTKPLKGHTAAPKQSGVRQGLIAAGLILFAAAPVAHFYGATDWLVSLGGNSDETIIAFEKPTEPAPQIVLRDAIEEKPERQYEVDPNAGALQELKPDGELNPPKPVLTPVIQPAAKPVRRQEQALAHLPDPELIERGASGVIPKRSADGLRAMDVYSRQPDTEGNFGVARVVIVIGGLGISQTSTQKAIQELPGNVTLAFAPYGNSLARWMQQARKSGHELLLQLPMEPLDYPKNNPGPHTLKLDVDLQENLANLHWSMSRLTNYVGVTNYLGNRMLAQPAGLTPIFSELADRGLMFFEDGSVRNSVAEGVAIKSLLPYAKGDIQLDNVRSRAAIAEKLNRLAEQAKRTGVAVGVGNAFPDTISMVAQFARDAKKNGIEITPVSAIAKDPAGE